MSGRGDNNKAGSAGRGASNQSNQPFTNTADRVKSNHGEQTGGKPSQIQDKTKDQSSHRDESVKKTED